MKGDGSRIWQREERKRIEKEERRGGEGEKEKERGGEGVEGE